ncbi:hypothetical protein [Natronospira bacteriovora]|uniref:Uncharacterized protein n=1 Tax=Natronospira bacteriovora TaxID=3069753 RepID=A0ABU0W5S4_9GAMM|nr:hypothetical protein [Natronospira sp. AB-CW4]MDQ2069278.1 hypothetical protein [Natronospira sp. AB-CW4]
MNDERIWAKEQFLEHVKDHEMTIIEDQTNEPRRHLRFRTPGTVIMGFDLITWPGHLCITGDMGTYVFSRVNDMFSFFRRDDLSINPGYWTEKVLAADRHHGIEKFSLEKFRAAVVNDFRMAWEDQGFEGRMECWHELRNALLDRHFDNGFEAVRAAMDFEHNGFNLQDFWENCVDQLDFGYLWNLYAIVWGIKQYYKHYGNTQVAA